MILIKKRDLALIVISVLLYIFTRFGVKTIQLMTSLVPIVSSDIYKTYFDSPDVGVILKVMDFRQTSSDSSSYTLVPKLYPELKHNLENLSVVLRMKPVIDNGRVLFLDALVGNILQSNDYSNRQMISFFLHGLVELDMANSQTMEQIDKNWCKEMSITSRLYPLCPSIEDYLESLLQKIRYYLPLYFWLFYLSDSHYSRGTTTMHVSDISHAHLFNFIAGNHDLFYIASVMRNPFVRGLGEYMWPLFRALTLIVPCNSIGLDFLLFSGIRQLALNCHPISYAISPKGRSVTCGSIVMIGASEGDRQTVITLDEPLVFENVVRIRVISLTLLVDHGASLSSLVRFKGGDRFQGMLELNNVFLRGGGIVISDLTRCFLDRCRVYDAVFGVRVSNVVDALFLNTSELPVGGWNFHNCLHAYACHDLGGMRLRFQVLL